MELTFQFVYLMRSNESFRRQKLAFMEINWLAGAEPPPPPICLEFSNVKYFHDMFSVSAISIKIIT